MADGSDVWDLPETPRNMINPDHYLTGGIEAIDYIRAKLTTREFIGYCKGNALKYLTRMGKKGPELDDFRKCLSYVTWGAEACELLDSEKDGDK